MIATIGMGATAQTYYDLTQYYLQNPDFTANVDYDINAAAENVKNSTLNTPKGWTLESASKANFAVVSTFQYGTKATFVNKAIPATGPDGTTNGVCLTLSAALGNHVTFYQSAKLPAGNYMLLVTYYNCNDASETATSLNGWFVNANDEVISQTTTFGFGEWRTDTVAFTLTDITDGRLQIGTKCSGTAVKNALLAVDNVRLLRDTPYGEQDNLVPPPTVTADPRFARGATMAFGRIKKVTGENITERGFCWSETPEPTINDNFTTDFLTNNGTIYVMRDLKPATIYYMRAYAKNSYGKVGYGEVIKFATVPKGNVTYWYNNGGDDAANKRVNAAAQSACDIFNNLTEIVKHFNIGYSAGTPTADCYYADEPWMNMGANSSYQRTGTIMHEMQHGLGLVPYTTQWNKNILRERLDGDGRGTGHWLGERVSAFLDFWDNTTDSQLNGDFQHMWPYGINGASEDNGSNELYIGNGLVCQALGEDGLQHTSQLYAEPYYAFDQEDDVKYYLKNEDADRGLYTAYLIPTATGTLQWRDMTASEAAANDSAAWYVTFTPSNQYYQLRNAATGQYLTYATNGFRTATRSALTANDNFHLMRSRVDVATGNASGPVIPADNTRRAFWLIHPTNNWSPACLQANANGQVGSATFNIANSATTQRWLILSEREIFVQEQNAVSTLQKQMADLLAPIKALLQVPHVELAPGTDDTFADRLADFEQRLASSSSPAALLAIETEARQAAYEFLCDAKPTDDTNPFDLTYLIKNPGMDSTEGWTGSPTLSYSCAEFYQKTFNFNQTISQLPAGNYRFLAQGFQRPGQSADAYNDYVAGNNNVTASLYAGDDSQLLAHIASEARSTKLGGNEATVGGNKYIPSNMEAASKYFAKGLYQNVVTTTVADASPAGNTLRVGIRSTSMPSYYWAIFDNFRLQFLGRTIPGDVNNDGQVGIGDIVAITNVMAGIITDEATIAAADVNNDNEVGIGDIVAITNIMAGIAN